MENYLAEAFQKLSLLKEDDFDITADRDVVDELKSFVADDVEEIPEEPVIDLDAESEDELADNYVGKVILECACCHTRLYKEEAEVVVDEESGLANADEACPVCNNTMGYTVIGKIEKFDDDAVEAEDDEIDFSNAENDPVDEAPVESFVDRLRRKRAALKEGKEDVCPECGKNPCVCEKCGDKDESLEESLNEKLNPEYVEYIKDYCTPQDFKYFNWAIDLEHSTMVPIDPEEAKTFNSINKAFFQPDEDNIIGKYNGIICAPFAARAQETLKKLGMTPEEFIDNADELYRVKFEPNEVARLRWLADRADYRSNVYDKNVTGARIAAMKERNKANQARAAVAKAKAAYGESLEEDGLSGLERLRRKYGGRAKAESIEEDVDDVRKNLIAKLAKDDNKDNLDMMIKKGKFKNYNQLANYISNNIYGMSLQDFRTGVFSKDQWQPILDVAKDIFNNGLDNWLNKNESCEEKLTEAIENLSMDTDDTHVEMNSTPDGGATVTVEPKAMDDFPADDADTLGPGFSAGDEEIVPLSDEEQEEIMANEPEGEEDEFADEFGEDEFELEGEPLVDEEEPEGGEEEEEEEEPEESFTSNNGDPINESVEEGEEAEIEDFDEENFDDLAESYLRKVYDNVKTFTTTSIKDRGDEFLIEGIITFKNDKQMRSSFTFTEANETKSGKIIFEGYNETFSKAPKSFKLKGTLKDKKYVAESMIYNYTVKNLNEGNGEKTKVSGRVRVRK